MNDPLRIIFLDVDGVLNSAAYFKSVVGKKNAAKARARQRKRRLNGLKGFGFEWRAAQIDPAAVARLDRIVRQTSAKLVLSSSWRYVVTLEMMRLLLKHHGMQVSTLIDRTPFRNEMPRVSGEGSPRGHEIGYWLHRHVVQGTPFAILDDGASFVGLEDRLVRTSWAEGLLDEHVGRVVDLLIEEK